MLCAVCKSMNKGFVEFESEEELGQHLKEMHGLNMESYRKIFRRAIELQEKEANGESASGGAPAAQRIRLDLPAENKVENVGPTLAEHRDAVAEVLVAASAEDLFSVLRNYVTENALGLQEHIPQPQSIAWDVQMLRKVALAIVTRRPLYIWGKKGTSKTYTLQQLAARIGQPLIRINGVGDMRTSHFVGRIAGKDGTTYWQEGLLPMAMRNGAWFLVDEVDIAPPQILNILQSVLDSRELTQEDTGHKIAAHEKFRIMFTANTSGRGDLTGAYAGTRPLNDAFLDRIGVWVKAEFPSEEQLRKIISAHMPDLDQSVVNRYAKFAYRLSASLGREGVTFSLSIRSVLAFLEYYNVGIRYDDALNLAFLDSISDDIEQQAISRVAMMLRDSLGE